MKIRICKTCGAENSPVDLECRGCMGDISGIRPVEKVEKIESAETPELDIACGAPSTAGKNLVLVSTASGGVLSIRDGDILGRERVGNELFASCCTVSREHAKIVCVGGEWTIEDVGSTNGTYINGRKLRAGQKHPLKAEDVVALSKSCELLVKMGGEKT